MRLRRSVLEQYVLFISVIKWFFLATATGIVVGASTTVFLKLLELAMRSATAMHYYFLLLPVAMLTSTLLVKHLAPEAEGHGTEKIIEAVHTRESRINPMVVPIKLAATIITIALGGSAGKEGPCAQIGAGISSSLASLLKFDIMDRRKLVICGISAGFATVFGTPIAGAIFGVEVLFVGAILYDVLLPSFVAGIVGFQVSSHLGIKYFSHPIAFVPSFTSLYFVEVCLSGVFFGICSFILIETLRFFERSSKSINAAKEVKAFVGGLVIALLAMVFGTAYLGLGLDTIDAALSGKHVPAAAFFMKSVFTSLTLSFGGSGGIVTPIFFVGTTSGSLFAEVLGLNREVFAAIGMVALLAGAANTPISASIMAAELFGPQITPYAALACVISFLITGHRSVYPSQVLAVTKSSSLAVQLGRRMDRLDEVNLKPRTKSVTGQILTGVNRAKRAISKRRGRRPLN